MGKPDLLPDLLIVGGGIVGCSAAAFAAERGASVLLLEATEVGAGASGRNSGVVQYPFDPVLRPFHLATIDVYRDLSADGGDLSFPSGPAGLLLLTDDRTAAVARVAELRQQEPSLAAELVEGEVLADLEPMLAGGLVAIRLATGYPIPPDAATLAMAARARRAGAEIRIGQAVKDVRDGPTVTLADGSTVAAAAVLVAAGPWSGQLLDRLEAWQPIRPTYGVTVQVALDTTPSSVLEEGAVHTVNHPVADDEPCDGLITFSMVSVAGVGTVGSTFLATPADPETMAPRLLAHGAHFVPALSGATIIRSRICGRPQSVDGHPFIGPMADREGVFLAAGHGPWGISTGPATARLAVESIFDGSAVPPELAASRTF